MKTHPPYSLLSLALLLILSATVAARQESTTVKIVDTGQSRCFSDRSIISCPEPGQPFFGQDAQYRGAPPAYRDNGDGTVTDLNTGLVWSQAVSPQKLGPDEAERVAAKMTLGGYSDWRVPTIKELYTLIDFRGYTGFSGRRRLSTVPANAIPFINTDYFDFRYGGAGERYIDAQWLSSTRYVSTTMGGMETLFGVNFADGRIKGYGYKRPGSRRETKRFYVRYVRGTPYGNNRFLDSGDGTVTDQSTGLIWARRDSGRGMNWQEALAYAEHLNLAGYNDWRLPNAKELQYIADYSRSPDTTGTAAIAPPFQSTSIVNEAGKRDFPAYWTSTTHLDGPRQGSSAVYIAFGRALGQMRGRILDVHGAGAQRSDPKTGRAEIGRGPQGDAVRVDNYVRVVRGGAVSRSKGTGEVDENAYPNRVTLAGGEERTGNDEPAGPGGFRPEFGGTPPEDSGKGFVRRLDRNGDGRVSRSEFDGPPDRFGFHDRNGDGYLTEDEAPRGPPPG